MGQDSVVAMAAGPICIAAKVIKSPAIDVKQMGVQTPRRPVSKTVSLEHVVCSPLACFFIDKIEK